VDGGSLLFKTNHGLGGGGAGQARITAETIVKAYNLIGYDAVGIGRRDLAAGLDFLLEIRGKSQFDWLSANIIDMDTDQPVFKPFVTRQLGGLSLAIIGLTGQIRSDSKLLDENVVVEPWRDNLPSIISKLEASHDFLILLTDLDAGNCREIAEMYPMVNLIVQAREVDSGKPPTYLTDSAILVGAGQKGKHIGVMEVDWRPTRKWRSAGQQDLTAGKKERIRLQSQMKQLRERPELKNHYDNIRERLTALENTLTQLERQEKSAAESVSSFDNRFVAMNVSLPDHPAVLDLVNENKKLVEALNRKSPPSTGEAVSARGFVGWTACRECHRKQVQSWQASRHATSHLTLVEKGQQFNLECLPCHVTGADSNDPAAAIGRAADLQVVGCESCHGPGSIHRLNPASQRTAPITEKICLACHTPEQDDSFDFEGGLKKLKCEIQDDRAGGLR